MQLYRICPEKYLENYTGMGASYDSGARWNHPGHPVMYFALSASVAMLEMANYIPNPRFVPPAYRLGVYDVNEDLFDTFDSSDLPENWADYPHPTVTQDIGTEWIQQGGNLGLIVPSAATAGGLENIALINAAHPKCNSIQLVKSTSKIYNPRIFSGLQDKK